MVQTLFAVPAGKQLWEVFNEELVVFRLRLRQASHLEVTSMTEMPPEVDAREEKRIREEYRKVRATIRADRKLKKAEDS